MQRSPELDLAHDLMRLRLTRGRLRRRRRWRREHSANVQLASTEVVARAPTVRGVLNPLNHLACGHLRVLRQEQHRSARHLGCRGRRAAKGARVITVAIRSVLAARRSDQLGGHHVTDATPRVMPARRNNTDLCEGIQVGAWCVVRKLTVAIDRTHGEDRVEQRKTGGELDRADVPEVAIGRVPRCKDDYGAETTSARGGGPVDGGSDGVTRSPAAPAIVDHMGASQVPGESNGLRGCNFTSPLSVVRVRMIAVAEDAEGDDVCCGGDACRADTVVLGSDDPGDGGAVDVVTVGGERAVGTTESRIVPEVVVAEESDVQVWMRGVNAIVDHGDGHAASAGDPLALRDLPGRRYVDVDAYAVPQVGVVKVVLMAQVVRIGWGAGLSPVRNLVNIRPLHELVLIEFGDELHRLPVQLLWKPKDMEKPCGVWIGCSECPSDKASIDLIDRGLRRATLELNHDAV